MKTSPRASCLNKLDMAFLFVQLLLSRAPLGRFWFDRNNPPTLYLAQLIGPLRAGYYLMGALLTDLLQRAQRSRRLVSLQTPAGTILGYVLSHNPELVLLRTITRQGMLTSVRSISLDEVSQVHFDDRYMRLIELKEHNPDAIFGLAAAPDGLEHQYLTVPVLLHRALEVRQLVQLITTSENDPYGYVLRLTDDELLFEAYTLYGDADGHSVLRVEDVRSVVWSDEETRTIELLLKQRAAQTGQ
jgi:hypothetical protein